VNSVYCLFHSGNKILIVSRQDPRTELSKMAL